MTKEQILDKHGRRISGPMLAAMDEWAKMYANFISDNRWTKLQSGRWRKFPYTYENNPITEDELYQLFIKTSTNG